MARAWRLGCATCMPHLDSNMMIQSGFHMKTIGYLENLSYAYWENTGWAAECTEQDITRSDSGLNWSLNGGDLVYVGLGCAGNTDCNYVHIADLTQGSSNFYFTHYVGGPAADRYSAICTFEMTQNVGFFHAMFHDPTPVEFCRASHWDTSLGANVETGFANYNAAAFWADEPSGNFIRCAWSDLPSNPNDPKWPNSTFTEERDPSDMNC